MKIAILVKVFPPMLGGTEIATLNIARNLGKKHDVFVITIKRKNFAKEEVINNFRVIRLSILNIPIISNFIYFLKILKILKKINPDIIHVQMLYSEALFCTFFKKFLNLPLVVSPRGTDIYISSNLYKKIVIKFILKNSDCILAQTKNQKVEIASYGIKNIVIVPNGVDLDKFKLEKSEMRRELGFKNEFLIIFVGRLHKVKGVDYLIKAMKYLVKKSENIKLLIIGDGKEKRKLKELVRDENLEENVIFKGMIENKLIPKYLTASDIFALPSISEGFPVTILEALASTLPIIASNVRGMNEIIENEKNGFLVEPKNSKKIAEKIIKLRDNEALRLKISENNMIKAREFSWENVIKRLEIAYDKALENKMIK